jgi:hypothetical protein
MPQQMYRATDPSVAGQRNPPATEIHAAFASSNTANSAADAHAHSSVALTALPETTSRR